MSATNRPRPGQPSSLIPDLMVERGREPACDCPACAGGEQDLDLDLGQVTTDLLNASNTLPQSEDPLDAEVLASLFVALAKVTDVEPGQQVGQALVEPLEASGAPGAATLLAAMGVVGAASVPPLATAARDASERLRAAGTALPSWIDELAEPFTASRLARLSDTDNTVSALTGIWRRAGRDLAFLITVDHEECGTAEEIFPVAPEDLEMILADLRENVYPPGVTVTSQELSASQFRWYAEQALQTRDFHDEQDGSATDFEFFADEDGPGYAPMSVLLRSRLAALPAATRPLHAVASAHSTDHTALGILQGITTRYDIPAVLSIQPPQPTSSPAPVEPSPRGRSSRSSRIYQLKIGLRGAKPPIWRRLLVPADYTLQQVHEVILGAFDWDGSHLHVFETADGNFGSDDPELGHQPDSSVTLERVAPRVGAKFSYTYDFGDDWEHQIVVENVLPREASVEYPVCTGGRRAAPPEDCGGIGAYEELIEILADPSRPEHAERLDWLGLEDAGAFTPAAFDAAEVTRTLWLTS